MEKLTLRLLFGLAFVGGFAAVTLQAAETEVAARPELAWHDDYATAQRQALEEQKLLLILFTRGSNNAVAKAFDTKTLADAKIQEALGRYVLVRLPLDAATESGGKSVKLLSHASFAEMLNEQGIAIVDYKHKGTDHFGHVVSTFPFARGQSYSVASLAVILDLPPGTLTQRTMIYAVRTHPERPASTQGTPHKILASEASQHSQYQAAITTQGHHSWDSRFQRINARMEESVLAEEVVAESWPNEGLVEACVDCVASWRQSPGHWGAVRARHRFFGYDIKRGRNGIWYATGIFGRR